MAKQRRARSRPVRSKPAASPPATAGRPAIVPARVPAQSRSVTDHAVEKPPRPGYLEAVALYEQGVAAIQEHDYNRGSSVLRSVLSRYPEEKEVHERVRLYLNVCDRHMTPRAVSPSTPEERFSPPRSRSTRVITMKPSSIFEGRVQKRRITTRVVHARIRARASR